MRRVTADEIAPTEAEKIEITAKIVLPATVPEHRETKTLPATARMIERRNPRPKTPRPEIRKAGTKRRRKTAETSAEISKIIESRKRNSPMSGHRKKRTTTVVPIPTARKIKAEGATVASLPQRHAARNRRRRRGEAFWILPRKKMRCSDVSLVKARRPLGAG